MKLFKQNTGQQGLKMLMLNQQTDSIPDGESPPAVNPLSARPRDTQLGASNFYKASFRLTRRVQHTDAYLRLCSTRFPAKHPIFNIPCFGLAQV